jgi:hypothetical protein
MVILLLNWEQIRRATITIGDEIEAQLDSWMSQQGATASLTTVVQAALKEFLALRGFGNVPRKLHITPSKKGSGSRDVSVAHDSYLAGK